MRGFKWGEINNCETTVTGYSRIKIGVPGAGNIGSISVRLWAEVGHNLMVSFRHPDQLEEMVKKIGKNALYGSLEEAAGFGEVVLFVAPLKAMENTIPRIKKLLEGTVVIDAMNLFPNRDGAIAGRIINRGIASGVATSEALPESKKCTGLQQCAFQIIEIRGSPSPRENSNSRWGGPAESQ